MKKLVVILMIVLGSIVSISNIFYSYSVYKGWGHVGNGTEGIISNGLTIVTLAVTVWMGITIYNTVEKNEIEDLKDTIKDYSPLSDKVKEYAKQQLLNQLYKTGEISSDYLAKKFSEDEEIPIERYSDILTIDILMEKLYVNSANVSVQQKREWADAGIQMINKYKGRHKKRYDLERYYLDYREGDFYFYLGNSMKVKDAVDMYSKALRAFTKAVSECHIDINLDMSEFQKLSKKEQRIVVYFANAIGQCQACIMQSEKEGSERYNAYLDKALTNLQYATQMAVYCGRREVYYRNYGCFLENTSHDEDERLSQAYEQYKRAFKVDATCVKSYHVIISNLNRRIRNKLGIQARYPHQARTINICDMDFNSIKEKGTISDLIDEMKRYIELAIRLFPTNSIWYGFLTYCVIYQVCIQQNGCFKNNTEAMKQLKVCADKIKILNGENNLCIVAQDEIDDIKNYCSSNKVYEEEKTMKTPNMTGYPSIDKPWKKWYKNDAETLWSTYNMYDEIWKNNKDHLDDIALHYFGNKITYRKFFLMIQTAENKFNTLGIQKGETVGFLSVMTPEIIVSFYALNRMGVTLSLMDPRTATENLAKYIQKANVKYLFVQDACSKAASDLLKIENLNTVVEFSTTQSMGCIAQLLYKLKFFSEKKNKDWIEYRKIKETEAEEYHTTYNVENEPALICYTGGTTGESKGVLLSNRNVNSIVDQFRGLTDGFQRQQKWLTPSIPFIAYATICSLHMPLAYGMQCYIELYDPKKMKDAVIKNRINHVAATPQFFEELAKDTKGDLSFLVMPTTGGDILSEKTYQMVNKKLADGNCEWKLCNGYGMTEVSSGACISFTGNSNKAKSVGIPLLYTVVSVFDSVTGEELKIGEHGEICISGPGVMMGYLNDELATAEVIKEHHGRRWMHTGDIGHIDQDGCVFIDGRIKRMIIRFDGVKIFPTYIEEKMLTCQYVGDCCCVAAKDEYHEIGQVPVVFYTTTTDEKDTSIIETELRRISQESLPEYSQPSAYKKIDELPRTNAGKVDYKKLEDMNSLDIK